MKTVNVIVERAQDGTYSVYCKDCPMLFGMGDSVEAAKREFELLVQLTRELGRDHAAFYPAWMDRDYAFTYKFDVQSLLEYYSGIITPTALGNLSGINPKQIWNYMHGVSKPRKAQVLKIESALHRLGTELSSITL